MALYKCLHFFRRTIENCKDIKITVLETSLLLCSTDEMCPKLVLTTKKRECWDPVFVFSIHSLKNSSPIYCLFNSLSILPSSSLIVNFIFLLSKYCL